MTTRFRNRREAKVDTWQAGRPAKSVQSLATSGEQDRERRYIVVWNMKRVIDTSEVLGSVTTPEGEREVCATADAAYDEKEGRVVVRLVAFLRNTDLLTKEKRFSAAWLPKPETVRESAGGDEAVDLVLAFPAQLLAF
jgi:hypothetical protein